MNVWNFAPESGGPHCMWVTGSVVGHHPALKRVFLAQGGWWISCQFMYLDVFKGLSALLSAMERLFSFPTDGEKRRYQQTFSSFYWNLLFVLLQCLFFW